MKIKITSQILFGIGILLIIQNPSFAQIYGMEYDDIFFMKYGSSYPCYSSKDVSVSCIKDKLHHGVKVTDWEKIYLQRKFIGVGYRVIDPIFNNILGHGDEEANLNYIKANYAAQGICKRSKHFRIQSKACVTWLVKYNKKALEKEIINVKPTDALRICQSAAKNFQQAIEGQNQHINDQDNQGEKNLNNILEKAKKFESSCLAEPDSNAIENELKHFGVLRIQYDDNHKSDPYCGVYRIGKQQFLTAMHCLLNAKKGLIDKKRLEASRIFLLTNPLAPISFNINSVAMAIDLSDQPEGVEREMPATEDLVILNTEKFDEAGDSDFQELIGRPNIWGEEVLLPGYFSYYSTEKPDADKWENGIRLTKSIGEGYCRLYDVSITRSEKACLIHRCQAVGGYSGSPLLQKDANGKYRLVGVHVRGAGAYDHHCPNQFEIGKANSRGKITPLSNFGNIATMVTTEFLTELGWNQVMDNEN